MHRTNSVELRNHLSETLNLARFGRERIEVRRRGRLLAAIVPPEDLIYLQENNPLTEAQRAARAANDLRILGFRPPPGLFAIEIGMKWRPPPGWPDVDGQNADTPLAIGLANDGHDGSRPDEGRVAAGPPESPAPCDPLL